MRNCSYAVAMIALVVSGCSAGPGPAPSLPATPTSHQPKSPTPSAETSESPSPAPSSTPTPSADLEKAAIRSAAQKYSDAYLTGDAKTAYAILSARCKKRLSKSQFARLVNYAESMYGSKLPFKTFSAKVYGDMARVTYTFSVKAINQTREPWVKESGHWREDDC